MKHRQFRQLESHYNDTNATMLSKLMVEKDAMSKFFKNEIIRMQDLSKLQLTKISKDYEKATKLLEDESETLEEVERELLKQRRVSKYAPEAREIQREKEKVVGASIELMKAYEEVIKLADQQTLKREKLLKNVIELEKKIDAKHALELEIERMKGALQVMKHMRKDEDLKAKKMIDKIGRQLKEKEDDLEAIVEAMGEFKLASPSQGGRK
ncbi:hypothetical protein Tsubulata_047044 [Turnera subulata]|uniref:Uncharacterized protein n=1 Tax=Turnera subulata TaxID=218843 RepID=A0A9Q0JPC2_9ROSI|nr:hypothetical protein Tsubulata_007378 [Turnera subulata]KAJ4849148.1 hypothetical protein Tsubulata_047044 [Turnera subulata]